MWTRRCRLALLTLRVRKFTLRIALPIRCLEEITEGFSDVLCLFGRAASKALAALSAADDALAMLRAHGPLDLMDVDAGRGDERVKVRLLLR